MVHYREKNKKLALICWRYFHLIIIDRINELRRVYIFDIFLLYPLYCNFINDHYPWILQISKLEKIVLLFLTYKATKKWIQKIAIHSLCFLSLKKKQYKLKGDHSNEVQAKTHDLKNPLPIQNDGRTKSKIRQSFF